MHTAAIFIFAILERENLIVARSTRILSWYRRIAYRNISRTIVSRYIVSHNERLIDRRTSGRFGNWEGDIVVVDDEVCC